ncbi:hypothetical protein A3B05_01680 [Candidatus Giovannonibacteria bacterium RIFCSPLOWO2_01_FULL_43_160]|uniref:Chitinase A1 n=2 Tax=Candidatus Giovannoniibacteriota TaxID=1752738 RepID=A0A0G1L4C2_9BACT|nr:MAG: chitinase A1 [Candidatus Giovannonibacteria bacterium GW2011_GWB1_43_13]KKS99566.1 MAG: chitinase A1 [Candidatus Giovannonibacteria bacterium GW2011_GWA1_43_15]KKT21643.1 MAG: chitinase A1 [Candidatus Giovannonibacteria bacterium GW2011_GWC2_43_8]KKT63447.1 MAG: chitinase A1 [Candidatus Giovannonibacteria bacterium GW2011_GWA2_44_26]OGF58222.1 MAG: hypothetical protein A2652_03380 [Candidatus Giovannonibacteria bacterium RIFCSPHIGHO2_01_FULL_43_140]OGF70359.1 MAG: hypothetical protein 
MKKLAVLLFLVLLSPNLVYAQSANLSSSTTAELQTQIQDLLKQVQALQQQVTTLKVELGQQPEIAISAVPPGLTRNLYRGLSGDDVRGLQQFLSQDKEIYPEGLVTGYFGPLTEGAVKRWQEKHDIESLGIIGPKTITRFNEFRGQTATPAIPAQPIGLTGTTTIPAQPATATSTRPRPESCAASYNYCVGPTECSANGYYWCRNSCYGFVDACLGQTYVAPVAPTPAPTPAPSTTTTTTTATVATTTTTTTATTTATTTTTTTPSSGQFSAPSWSKSVWTGSEYGIVWSREVRNGETEIFFARTTSGGIKIGNDLMVSTGHSTADDNYAIAWNGSNYGIIYEDYWGNVPLHSNTYSSYSTYFSRINSQGQKSGADIKIATGGQYNQMNLFWNGSEYILIYINYRPNEIRFRKFSPDGQPLGSIKTISSEPTKEIDTLSVALAGTEYVLSVNYLAAFGGGGSKSLRLSASGDLINIPTTTTTATTITSITPYSPIPPNQHLISSITLQWNTTTNDLTYRRIWRRFGGGDWLLVGQVQGNTFSDLNIGTGTYYYKLNTCSTVSYIPSYGGNVWVVTDNCGPDSNIMTTTLTMGGGGSDTTPPSTPTGLRVWPDPYNRNFLSWTASTDNIGVAGYNIYRNGTYLKSACCIPSEDGNLFYPSLTTYSYTVAAYDAAGNVSAQSSSVSATTADTTPPAISSIQTSNITQNAATISWSTNEIADSQVEYGATLSYGNTTAVDSALVTAHSAQILNLAGSITYHFRVKSKDATGNIAVSGDNTFISLSPPSSSAPPPSIKTGTGTVGDSKTFSFGTGTIEYSVGGSGVSGYIYSGIPGSAGRTSPILYFANPTPSDTTSCGPYPSSHGYQGITSICQFTSAANYIFSNAEDSIRIYDKSSPCYQGILLFKQNNLYGGIDPEDVDSSGALHYRYWYDESGGSNFSSVCATSYNTAPSRERLNQLASVLDAIKSALGELLKILK